MRAVPIIRLQDAYNCGVYSLWMALESVTGQDDSLITNIENRAHKYAHYVGGLFDFRTIEKILTDLGYKCTRVPFHNVSTFNAVLDKHQNSAIAIAYDYYKLFPSERPLNNTNTSTPTPAPYDVGSATHWSVLTARSGRHALELANPHGTTHQIVTENIVNANLALKGATINWREFTKTEKNDADYKREKRKYHTTDAKLKQMGRMNLALNGFFVAITR